MKKITLKNKKVWLGAMLSFAFVAIIGVAFAFKPDVKKTVPVNTTKAAALYWYHVNPSTNETIAAYSYNDTKANVINTQSCKDNANQPICLFGSTNASLPVGTDVGTPAPDNRILEKN
ncbi:hypothetical protein [Mucilaginibacter aquaedulcis]|uniref:hypothetical protein n=1 Tax=Mucilaginibacter aquaedulcis TaxID=1187081 RepID=UPI0025B2D3A8|nr:hypothetical protein [Mucilaginibacter aquaedulcis]MDN3551023.1 hypothetical protein [Mucilaginibacter aquaedulcis]